MLPGTSSRETLRWIVSGAVVLCVHGAIAAAMMTWSDPLAAGGADAVVTLDMSPVAAAPTTEKSDIAPDTKTQQQTEEQPEPEDKPQEKVEETPQPPPPVDPPQKAEVALPPPPKPVEKKKPQQKMAAINTRQLSAERVAPRASSPSPGAGGAARAQYGQLIVAHLNRFKNYPSASRSRHEEGVVMLAFTLDRGGRVVASRIARGSGFGDLDREALDMLRRAQPFPTPPPDLTEQRFSYTAPMRYDLR